MFCKVASYLKKKKTFELTPFQLTYFFKNANKSGIYDRKIY